MKMATIKLGAAISDIRGSIGGTVFSRNGGGAYAKARIKGTNPNTAPQQMVRAIISSMFAAWTLLTGAVRTGWANYAANVSMINRLGDVINLSGYNMYTRSRALFEMIGATMPATAPSVMALAEQDGSVVATPSAADGTISIAFDNGLGWAGEIGGRLLVYCSRPQNATVNSFSGPYKYIGKEDGAVVPPTSPVELASGHTLVAGQKLFMQYRIVRADGRVSTPFRGFGDVGA